MDQVAAGDGIGVSADDSEGPAGKRIGYGEGEDLANGCGAITPGNQGPHVQTAELGSEGADVGGEREAGGFIQGDTAIGGDDPGLGMQRTDEARRGLAPGGRV